MAYDREKVLQEALTVSVDKKLFFIEDVISFIAPSKPTFYDFFPIGSNELNTIKEILERNKIEVKSAMRSKWFNSDNATLQVALMKIIGTEDEAHRLNGSHHKLTGGDGEPLAINALFNIDLMHVPSNESGDEIIEAEEAD